MSKILNPQTNRQVDVSGATAKKVYKLYLKGALVLRPQDIVLLQTISIACTTFSKRKVSITKGGFSTTKAKVSITKGGFSSSKG
jgi:hypothetical protein